MNNRQLTISTAPSRFSTDWQPRTVAWPDLLTMLRADKATAETAAEYQAMAKPEKANIKDIGGFVGGYVKGHRNAGSVESRSLVTLDIDYALPDTISTVQDLLDGNAWCLYSTHSHTPNKPRYRLVIPLDRDVSPEEYVPIARWIAGQIGIDTFDDSTYEVHRLMYWPSHPKDVDAVFESGDGVFTGADAILRSFRDWRDLSEWPVSSRVTKHLTPGGRKQEDPTKKGGVIGAFCRTYTISTAIEEFLSDVYEPTTTEGRYTYKEGSSAGGLVVYEDKWAYSHHGTDPVGGREVNAFDLVRIHKFGNLDEQTSEETPVNRLPSFTKMAEWCREIPTVKAQLIAAGIGMTPEEAFGPELEDRKWTDDFQLDGKGARLNSPFNFKLICDNDPELKGTVRYDAFADRPELTRDLPWLKISRDHQTWNDNDDQGLVIYISSKWKMQGKGAILDAHDLCIAQSGYHPLRDYLNSLTWDGVERLDAMIIDYLGARGAYEDDTPEVKQQAALTMLMTRKHMVAAVARVMSPGTKYDNALTLSGPEGIGKTTLIKNLGMRWFDNSFSSGNIGDKESMDQIRGRWLIELGELTDLKKNTNEAFKHFLSKEKDKFRPAYARKQIEVPRQCVFWATTNERCFLKGDTGNRRFWTIYCGVERPTKNVFKMTQEDIDQLWAEAVHYYRQGEELMLPPKYAKLATARADDANEMSEDGKIGMIEAFIRQPIPTEWNNKTRRERADWFRFNHDQEFSPDGPENRRKFICAQEIANELYGREISRYDAKEINFLLGRIEGLEPVGKIRTGDKVYGGQNRFRILPKFWENADDEQLE